MITFFMCYPIKKIEGYATTILAYPFDCPNFLFPFRLFLWD